MSQRASSGVDSLAVEVERQRDDVHVAGALAVAEEGPFHALGSGQHRQLRGRDRRAAIVVRMNAQRRRCRAPSRSGRTTRSGRRRRWEWLISTVAGRLRITGASGVGFQTCHHRLADLHREVELGGAEALRGVLRHDLGLGNLCAELLDQLRPRDGDLDDAPPGEARRPLAAAGRRWSCRDGR